MLSKDITKALSKENKRSIQSDKIISITHSTSTRTTFWIENTRKESKPAYEKSTNLGKITFRKSTNGNN